MENSNTPKGNKLQRVFRLNMLIGIIISAIAAYFIITGSYNNIQAREAAETTMGWIAIGGLLYVAAFWYMCVFRKQLFLKSRN